MRVVLRTGDGTSVEYDSKLGFRRSQTIPCLQCGTCCARWQPQVDAREVARIASNLEMPLTSFYRDYVQEYPVRRNTYLIKRKDGACIFLQRLEHRAVCSIHRFKPAVCQAWVPSLERKECRHGLEKLGPGRALLTPGCLNLSPDDTAIFYRSLVDFSQEGEFDR